MYQTKSCKSQNEVVQYLRMNYRYFILFIFLIILQPLCYGQESRITFLGNLNKPRGISGSTYFSSCWGYTSLDGHEYALLGTCEGTSIIDLDSDSLREVQFIPGPFASYCLREMKTWKHYAYITSEGGGGTQIIDLSGLPDTAILVKNFIYTDSSVSKPLDTKKVHTISIADGLMFLNGCQNWRPFGGSVIFSLLNDPTNPEYVTEISRAYFHDTYTRNDTLYASSVYDNGLGGLYIIDLTDINAPLDLGRITYPGSGTHNSWVSLDAKFVFTTDEINSTPHNLKVWYIENLPYVQKVASWQADPQSIVHNVFGRGNYLYIAHYTAGMAVVDVHNPTNPTTVGWYDSYPGESGGYYGSWNVYPYFPSGRWIGSDMQTGLYLFRFDSLKARVRSQLLYPPNNQAYSGTEFRWTSAADQAEDPHFYELHIQGTNPQSGIIDTVFTTKDTSFTFSQPWEGTYSWYIHIRDENTEIASADTFHFNFSPNGISDDVRLPISTILKQNYPNPFNPLTKIEFELSSQTEVTLKIYNALGNEVRTLLDHVTLGAGKQEVVFQAHNLPSGTYYYRLTTPTLNQTKEMVLIK